jgi:3-oxoacyl-[acyl-carrier protein] reductase
MMDGRVVLLTGGTRGIGEATVHALHAAGARVFFTYASAADRARATCDALGERVHAVKCDLSDHASLPGVVDACIERFGKIDVLVNNAAIFAENPFWGTTYDAWRAGFERTFAVNLFGTADLTWLVLQHMRERRGGTVLNVVSRAAHRGELTFADYGASKAALTNLTKSIARSCARDGIVAIAIAPGFIETEMAEEELQRRRHEIEGEIPGRRVGAPAEVASIIAFFASGGGDYANGATIDVNGGSYVR